MDLGWALPGGPASSCGSVCAWFLSVHSGVPVGGVAASRGSFFSGQWQKRKKASPTMQAGCKPLLVSRELTSHQSKPVTGPSRKSEAGKYIPLLMGGSEKSCGKGHR